MTRRTTFLVTPLFHLDGFAASYVLTGSCGIHAFLPVFSTDALLVSDA